MDKFVGYFIYFVFMGFYWDEKTAISNKGSELERSVHA